MVVIATANEIPLAQRYFPDEPILITGVGGTNVIKALSGLDRSIPIHNTGYAGSNSLPVGKAYIIGRCSLFHETADFAADFFELGKGHDCYTSCDFVTHTEKTEPCIFDMELAFICALGFKSIESIKVISDNLSYKKYEETISHV